MIPLSTTLDGREFQLSTPLCEKKNLLANILFCRVSSTAIDVLLYCAETDQTLWNYRYRRDSESDTWPPTFPRLCVLTSVIFGEAY